MDALLIGVPGASVAASEPARDHEFLMEQDMLSTYCG
jgi:hypothetical protein